MLRMLHRRTNAHEEHPTVRSAMRRTGAIVALTFAALAVFGFARASALQADGTVGQAGATVTCYGDSMLVTADMWATVNRSAGNMFSTAAPPDQQGAFRIHVYYTQDPARGFTFSGYSSDWWWTERLGDTGGSQPLSGQRNWFNLRTRRYGLPDRIYMNRPGYYKVLVEYYWYAVPGNVASGSAMWWTSDVKNFYAAEVFSWGTVPYCKR